MRYRYGNISLQRRLALKGFNIGNNRLGTLDPVTVENFQLQRGLDVLGPVNQTSITVLRQLFDLQNQRPQPGLLDMNDVNHCRQLFEDFGKPALLRGGELPRQQIVDQRHIGALVFAKAAASGKADIIGTQCRRRVTLRLINGQMSNAPAIFLEGFRDVGNPDLAAVAGADDRIGA